MAEPTSNTGKNQQGPCAASEEWIDNMVEDSFPASDPPAWTIGITPSHRDVSDTGTSTETRVPAELPAELPGEVPGELPGELNERQARALEHGAESDASHAHEQEPPSSGEERDRIGPGKAFWDMSPEEQRRISTAPDSDDIDTEMPGRRDTTEGPHEPLPGTPRSLEHREHAGSRGEPLPYRNWTRRALYARARTLGIEGRSRMSKTELVRAIEDRGPDQSADEHSPSSQEHTPSPIGH